GGGGGGFYFKKSHAMRWESHPEQIGLDAERAPAAPRRPEIGDGEGSAGARDLAEVEAVGPCRVAPVVDGDDRAPVRVGAYPERRQLLGGREPMVLRLALGRAEEMNRLGRGSADESKHVGVPTPPQ